MNYNLLEIFFEMQYYETGVGIMRLLYFNKVILKV